MVYSQVTLEFTLTEECPLHTFVGNLNGVSPSTINLPYPVSSFQLITQTNQFVLNETSGDLFTRSRIDRERLCPQQMQSSTSLDHSGRAEFQKLDFPTAVHSEPTGNVADSTCKVQLQALQFTQKSSSESEQMTHRVILIKINILDVNDNPPGWPEGVIHISVPEHSTIGTRIPLPAAFDPDCGPANTTVSYVLRDLATEDRISQGSLTPYGHEAFQLDTEFVPSANPTEVGLGTMPNIWLISGCSRRMFRLWLRVVRDLDYDKLDGETAVSQQQSTSGSFPSNRLRLRNARLHLIASDGGQPNPLTGHVMINITITDINDHAPTFLRSGVGRSAKEMTLTGLMDMVIQETIDIDENAPTGRVVYVARATDIDEVDNGQLQYKIDSSASLLVRKMFEVNSKTGEVILLQSPDFEKRRLYNVPLSVTDGKHVASMELVVRIKNQNDHPPVINIRPVGQPKDEHITKSSHPSSSQSTSSQFPHSKSIVLHVVEHDQPGRFIATVTVTDIDDMGGPDDGREHSVDNSPHSEHSSRGVGSVVEPANSGSHCKLSHVGLGLQPLFEGSVNQFKLITVASFDREQQTEHFATLTCFDRGHPPLSTQIGIHLIIDDINDHGPTFKHTTMIAYLKENEPIGVRVYTVEAHDPDVGEHAQLGFALDNLNSDDFAIDMRTGVISSLRSFDREQRDFFNLTVIVRDQVAPTSSAANSADQTVKPLRLTTSDRKDVEHTAVGHVIVYIKDVNDCPPLFPNSLYQLSVSEDAKINFLIGQINASDADATETNNQVSVICDENTI
ncbi:Protocadherin-9 [Fasciolopsis buskii]|uniref:Protocadherin-9 n=1 Tax=Fasciolopsis buskii TaxID=27845 RepID=A0A8E0RSD7_9TREM|nr:Protocadherin-9 [Fasciolopsis buski]